MSENRAMFEEAAGRLFLDEASQGTIEAAEAGMFPHALWEQLGGLGFLSMIVGESEGGVGADFEDAAAVLRVAGYHAAPGPIVQTVIANWVLALAGQASTPRAIALLIGAGATTAPWLGKAGMMLRVVGDRLWVIEAGDIIEGADAAGEPLDRLNGHGHTVAAAGLADAEGLARRAIALLRAAQMVGAMEWCVERSVAYAHERSQFGRPLARLQIVQQYLAQAAGELVAADAITGAAARAGVGVEATALIAAARSRAADAADIVAALCHQVHGAIGFSREYALNFRTRRLIAWRDDAGSSVHWRRTLGAAIAADTDGPWAGVTRAMAVRTHS